MVSGVVLAGGASRRMGRDKAWVELGGVPLVVRVLAALRQVCDEIIVVTNTASCYDNLDVRLVRDEYPGKGSLGGLYSGLNAAQNELAFAVACDMPFLNPALVQFLITLSSDYDVIIPSQRDAGAPSQEAAEGNKTAKRLQLHPLHAVYRKTCLAPVRTAIEREDLRMISFHNAARVRVVERAELEQYDPQLFSLWNVNTPEELQRAEQALAQNK